MITAGITVNQESKTSTGWVFNVQRFCSDDGPGIRTSVFLKGCPLRCQWCHNPESQLPLPQFGYDRDRCLNCSQCFEACPNKAISTESPFPSGSVCSLCGTCVDVCPSDARRMIGGQMTVGEILAEVNKDRAFYEESGGGVTFTGGEPLSQSRFLLACLNACRQADIHTTLDTCGYAHWDDLKAAANHADLVLYDVKGMDEERHKQTTGVSNHRILRNLYCLATLEVDVWVRVPLIPGINDDEGSLQALGGYLADLPRRFPVWLLPYHRLGRQKRSWIGMQEAPEFAEPSSERVEECAAILHSHGLDVRTKP